MENSIGLDTIISWLIMASTLGGLGLLVRHQRWGWALLLFPLLWYLIEDVFDDKSSGILMLLNDFRWTRLLNIGVLFWCYFQWRDSRYNTALNFSNNDNILDDLEEEQPVLELETYQLSKQNIQQPILVGIGLFVALFLLYLTLDIYSLRFFYFLDLLFQTAFLLSFYLLAKRYVEGWLLFIVVFLAEAMLYGFSFHIYSLTKLGIYIWGYTEWKKIVNTTNSSQAR